MICQATASFAILANRPPNAVDDTVMTDEDTPVIVDVLANDSDPDRDALAVSVVGSPANGTIVTSGNAITYTPVLNFNGTDVFNHPDPDADLYGNCKCDSLSNEDANCNADLSPYADADLHGHRRRNSNSHPRPRLRTLSDCRTPGCFCTSDRR